MKWRSVIGPMRANLDLVSLLAALFGPTWCHNHVVLPRCQTLCAWAGYTQCAMAGQRLACSTWGAGGLRSARRCRILRQRRSSCGGGKTRSLTRNFTRKGEFTTVSLTLFGHRYNDHKSELRGIASRQGCTICTPSSIMLPSCCMQLLANTRFIIMLRTCCTVLTM